MKRLFSSVGFAIFLGVAFVAFMAIVHGQSPPVGMRSVTVSWSPPTLYSPVSGVVTSAAVATAPPGALTDGTYPIFMQPRADGEAWGLEASVTVTGGVITSVAITQGGSGWVVGDTSVILAADVAGATGNGTLKVTGITTTPAAPLPASDIDHYTIRWVPHSFVTCTRACGGGPVGEVEVPATATSYTIPYACGDLEVMVEVATGPLPAHVVYGVSNWAAVEENTGYVCPNPGGVKVGVQ